MLWALSTRQAWSLLKGLTVQADSKHTTRHEYGALLTRGRRGGGGGWPGNFGKKQGSSGKGLILGLGQE